MTAQLRDFFNNTDAAVICICKGFSVPSADTKRRPKHGVLASAGKRNREEQSHIYIYISSEDGRQHHTLFWRIRQIS